jgi:hypothetical protein
MLMAIVEKFIRFQAQLGLGRRPEELEGCYMSDAGLRVKSIVRSRHAREFELLCSAKTHRRLRKSSQTWRHRQSSALSVRWEDELLILPQIEWAIFFLHALPCHAMRGLFILKSIDFPLSAFFLSFSRLPSSGTWINSSPRLVCGYSYIMGFALLF